MSNKKAINPIVKYSVAAIALIGVEEGQHPEEVEYFFRKINAFAEAESKGLDVSQWGCTRLVKDPWNCNASHNNW
jgi:hypothetical protein